MNNAVALTREQVRRIDRLAIESYGMTGLVLMENAGRAVTDVVLDAAPEHSLVVILCGGGNNGGDGYVVARHLGNAGRKVLIDAAKDPSELTGDAAANAQIVARMGIDVRALSTRSQVNAAQRDWLGAAVIVDALLGTGFSNGQVRSPTAWLIDRCNHLNHSTVVAIDVPSGLDCDTGEPAAPTIQAGFEKPVAHDYLGRVVVGDIGVPRTLIDQVGAGR
jgi:NAD(P)H-hydrate epimerase